MVRPRMTRLALAALVVSATLPFVAAQAQMSSEPERASDTSVEEVAPALQPDADPVASASAASPAVVEDVTMPPPVPEPSIAVPAAPLEATPEDAPAPAPVTPSAGPASPADVTPVASSIEPT